MISSVGSEMPLINDSGCMTGCLSLWTSQAVHMSDPSEAGTKSPGLSTLPDVLQDRYRSAACTLPLFQLPSSSEGLGFLMRHFWIHLERGFECYHASIAQDVFADDLRDFSLTVFSL